VQLVPLPSLLERADFVLICCALTADTHHLIGAPQLQRMKPTAHLINVARGPIVDQVALTEALQRGTIAGAALDVFEQEPPPASEPLLQMDNVILAPHALSWTDESFRMMGESAFTGILAVSQGRAPDHVVNAEVLDTERFQTRLAACAHRRVQVVS
jgi:D-3-phosphoglycerate dehydrogenase